MKFNFVILKAREEAYQEELERARVEREKEIARLRAQQERAKDKQAEKVRSLHCTTTSYTKIDLNHLIFEMVAYVYLRL